MTSVPLVSYSETLERASIFNPNKRSEDSEDDIEDIDDEEDLLSDSSSVVSMPPRRRGRKRGTRKAKGGHRLKAGRINLRIPGFGLQKLGASQLVRFVPLSKLKAAAKKVLRASGVKRLSARKGKKGRRGRGKKSRKSRRRRRRKTAAV